MAQRPEDFNLPLSAIRKILQDSMPNGVRITDGAKLALSKAASIFILYLTTAANGFSQDNSRKRVLGKDVIDALIDLDLGFLVPSLQTALSEHHKSLLNRKQARSGNASRLETSQGPSEEDVIIIESDSGSEAAGLDTESTSSVESFEQET